MATLALTHNLRNPYAPTLSALALGLLALGVLFHAEAAAAVQVWIDSTAYGHCFLVLPMALYLAWDRRASLVGVPVRPTFSRKVLRSWSETNSTRSLKRVSSRSMANSARPFGVAGS